MFRNYIKTAFRSIGRNKIYSMVNVTGLTIGIVVCLMVFLFVRYEMGFDKFHNKNIVRLYQIQEKQGFSSPKKITQTKFPMAATLKSEFPEIKNATQVISWETVPLKSDSGPAISGTILGTDNSFLSIFNFEFLSGNIGSALKTPNSIVLTREMASRLFKGQDPIGKTVYHFGRDSVNFTVRGVLADIPSQSHLQFDALYSMDARESAVWLKDWEADWVFTYLELEKGTDISSLEARFPIYLNKHLNSKPDESLSLALQPLNDIHLKSKDFSNDFLNRQKFEDTYINLLIAVAIFILAIAVINYVNLTTSKSAKRAKEVGIRKVNGASGLQIIMQFVTEALIMSFLAMILAMAIIELTLPHVARATNSDLRLNLSSDFSALAVAFGISLVTGLIAGIFPALSLASVQPLYILKGQLWVNSRSRLRNALVVVQFTVAIALSMATVTAFRQLNYIQDYDTGFDKTSVAVLHVSYTDRQKVARLMQQIRNTPGVSDVTGALRRLGNSIDLNKVVVQTTTGERELTCGTMFVDFNYLSFYKIPLIAGRDLSTAFGDDKTGKSYIINETMAKLLIDQSPAREKQLKSLIGQNFRYSFQDAEGKIVGISKDFNFNSLHQKVEPLSITYQYDYYFTELSIRLDSRKTDKILSAIQQHWNSNLPNQPFEYHFLEDHLRELYKTDRQTSAFIASFTIIGLIISAIGLIALAAFNIQERTKEIGLRKVLGASETGIVTLLSKSFIKLIALSILIAIPISWWLIGKWLNTFAYQIELSLWAFLAIGLSALLLALLTVSYQALKAARANPIKSLRTE